jgi:MFS-type transporter involved in bile tolerance (Atg22 family)
MLVPSLLAGVALAAWAVVGMVFLIAKPKHRTVAGYSAVLLAVAVCGLLFVPTGLLTTDHSATKPPSAEMLSTIPRAPQK